MSSRERDHLEIVKVGKIEIQENFNFVKMIDSIKDPFIYNVIPYLTLGDVSRFCRINKEWNKKKKIWRILCERDFPGESNYKSALLKEYVIDMKNVMEMRSRSDLELVEDKKYFFISFSLGENTWKKIVKIEKETGKLFTGTGKIERGNLFHKDHGIDIIHSNGHLITQWNKQRTGSSIKM